VKNDSDSDDSDSDDSDAEKEDDEIINLVEPKQDENQVEEETFEYGDVMDGSHTHRDEQIDMDEDIGGKSVASVAVASGIVGGSLVMKNKKRNMIITGIIVSGVIALISYFIWKKISDMKKELERVEIQQNMLLNDKDVEVITLDTIESYIRDQQGSQEHVSEDTVTESTDGDVTTNSQDKLDTITEEDETEASNEQVKLVKVKLEQMPKSIVPPTKEPIILDGAGDEDDKKKEVFEDAVDDVISIEDDLSVLQKKL